MNAASDGWRPSCSMQMLQVRAEMLRAIRQFFQNRGYLEVETPCLSRDIVLDAWLEPFSVTVRGEEWFLQTSPESHMKRLLAAGVGSMFQVSRVFRQEERGLQHNAEFTMIEWYGVRSDWLEQIEVTESLVRTATAAAAVVTGQNVALQWSPESFRITAYASVFQRTFGINVFECSGDQLIAAARQYGITLPAGLNENQFDDVLNIMLAIAIEPQMGGPSAEGRIHPEFLCDYPPSQAALAVVSETHPAAARRFELYIQGMELCNGYQELTDVVELQRRDDVQNQRRIDRQSPKLPGSPRLLSAMESGLPPCSGVALGFDRLVMLATDRADIQEVIPFPENRA